MLPRKQRHLPLYSGLALWYSSLRYEAADHLQPPGRGRPSRMPNYPGSNAARRRLHLPEEISL